MGCCLMHPVAEAEQATGKGGKGSGVGVAFGYSLAHRLPSPSGPFFAEPGCSWVILEGLWALTGLV